MSLTSFDIAKYAIVSNAFTVNKPSLITPVIAAKLLLQERNMLNDLGYGRLYDEYVSMDYTLSDISDALDYAVDLLERDPQELNTNLQSGLITEDVLSQNYDILASSKSDLDVPDLQKAIDMALTLFDHLLDWKVVA